MRHPFVGLHAMQNTYRQTYKNYLRLFGQGVKLGLRALRLNGPLSAGIKRSIGFVLQPIENWSRYPEIVLTKNLLGSLSQKKVLDLGSPKMVGLMLAEENNSEFTLTDIWTVAVDEVRDLVSHNKNILKGIINLKVADLTQLHEFSDGSFDAIYSISVIEHIESLEAIKKGLKEISRVLKPKGVFVVSFCARSDYVAQYVDDGVYALENKGSKVFFAHYFDPAHISRIFFDVPHLQIEKAYFIEWLTQKTWLKIWMHVPSVMRGFLGIVNLLIAPFATRTQSLDLQKLDFQGEGDVVLRYTKETDDIS